jgi:hypothetical protein
MRHFIRLLSISILFAGCSLIQGYDNFTIVNEFGRVQLKPEYIELKKSFDISKKNPISFDAIYFHHSENKTIDMEFNFVIRFFSTGQFAFFGGNQKPIIGLTYKEYQYNELSRASDVGYYNVKDSLITVEYANNLFRRGGRRNLDEYRILPNGNLKSITRAASDYKAVYEIITSTDQGIKQLEPDW